MNDSRKWLWGVIHHKSVRKAGTQQGAEKSSEQRGITECRSWCQDWSQGCCRAQKPQSALRDESELFAVHQNRVWGKTSHWSGAGSPPVLPQDRHLNLEDAAPGLSLGSNSLFG